MAQAQPARMMKNAASMIRCIGHLRLRPQEHGGDGSGSGIAHSIPVRSLHEVAPRGYAAGGWPGST